MPHRLWGQPLRMNTDRLLSLVAILIGLGSLFIIIAGA
jgi:hypothetical protein